MNRSDDENYHGLVAQSYDLFRGDEEVEELPWFLFYKRRLEERPGLALEPACGTGRILLPFLKAGFPMEGTDSSAEMLAICRQKAETMGLSPVLYEQYMQETNLPKHYTTILIPLGSFILIRQHADAREALRRFHAHLVEGGQLVFSTPTPSPQHLTPRSEQSDTFGEPSIVTLPSNGATITLKTTSAWDRFEQIQESRQVYELRDNAGQLLKIEEHHSITRWYGKYEMLLMLQEAGFRSMKVFSNHTDEEADSESWSRIYWAEK